MLYYYSESSEARMYLSRIKIVNFRNFSRLDVQLAGNIVVLGENRVGKSNLLYALRIIFDPALPDSARQLSQADFWDGLALPDDKAKIVVSVEIKDFESDLDVLTLLTDYRLDDDPETVRLTYEFRPKAGLKDTPASDHDYDSHAMVARARRKSSATSYGAELP